MSDDVTPDGLPSLDALSEAELDMLRQVAGILRRLRYGTVLLVVQDGRVVQIEMAEKFRLS